MSRRGPGGEVEVVEATAPAATRLNRGRATSSRFNVRCAFAILDPGIPSVFSLAGVSSVVRAAVLYTARRRFNSFTPDQI